MEGRKGWRGGMNGGEERMDGRKGWRGGKDGGEGREVRENEVEIYISAAGGECRRSL